MKKENVLLVLDEDGNVIVTNINEYNENEGSEYEIDYEFPVSIENAKSYGNGNKEWERVLDEYSNCELFEIEIEWGEGSLILVK
jgi:hypothetical protein